MSDKVVVIYGASGYSGRLIAEYLREYRIPFIAAGRNKERIETAMSAVPGKETADYEIVEVQDTLEDLTELLKGKKVFINCVGPFIRYAEKAVQACLANDVHYMDCGGEQAFLRMLKETYGPQFAAKGLVCMQSMAYMFTPLDIAVNIVLENEDVNTLETCNLVTGVPTEASTQTIMCMIDFENCYLQDNQLVEWPRAKGYEVALPGHLATTLCHPWGGTGFPIWYQDHPTVRNVKSLTAFNDRSLLEALLALQTHYEENLRDLPQEQRTAELSKVADSMTPGMPPREEMLVHRSLDVVIGTGTSGVHTCVIRSGPAYLQTGLYMAAATNKLLTSGPDNVGTVSPCQAFGYKYLLGALKTFFPTEVDIY